MALVLAGKPLSPASRSRLATELDSVLNPSKYPQAKIQAIYDDIQAVFQENGADRRQAVAIVDDIKAFGTR
jgi:deoxyribose-phosphate aldolase